LQPGGIESAGSYLYNADDSGYYGVHGKGALAMETDRSLSEAQREELLAILKKAV
jgi:hypothetical protein